MQLRVTKEGVAVAGALLALGGVGAGLATAQSSAPDGDGACVDDGGVHRRDWAPGRRSHEVQFRAAGGQDDA